jgi:methyl-accepting chemotaxis protein
MRMVYALDEITRDVDAAEQCASQIEAINSQTRYLALNAAIEANRSGGAGTAFGVIAHEMKTLSLSTAETSAQVRQRISAVATGVRAGHAVLKEIATLDMSEHIMAKQRLDALIAGVIGQNQSFNLILGDAASASKDISGTIGQLIMGIQFQDRNKQHTAHVVGALEVLGEATEGLQEATSAAYPGSFQLGAVDEAWLARLVANNTLESVKQRLLTRLVNGDALDGGAQDVSEAEPDVAEDDIELF